MFSLPRKNLVQAIKTPTTMPTANTAHAVAAMLSASEDAKNALDFNRRYSLGMQRGKTLISEGISPQSVSFSISNTYATAKTVVLGSLVNSMFASETALKTALSADGVITDGVIITDGTDTVTVTSNDPGRSVGNFLRYCANSPTRIVAAQFTSLNNADNSANSSNYDGTITTAFVSPFADPVKNPMNMRQLRGSQDFAREYAEVDFRAKGLQVLISPENFTTFVIQPATTLTIVLYVGAQASTSQRMYRDLSNADETLANATGSL